MSVAETAAKESILPIRDADRPTTPTTPHGREWLTLQPLLPLLLPLALLVLWWQGSAREWLPPQLLPPPALVATAFADLLRSGELQTHLGVSLMRVLQGFFLGGGLGLAVGMAMGLSRRVSDYLHPLISLIAYVPLLGWLPLLMMVFGIGDALQIILVSKAAFLPVVLNTFNGIRNVPASYIEVAQSYQFNRRQLLWRVILPAAFPSIWNGVRYGLTKTWLALVVVELLASSAGLGFIMVNSRQLYQLDVMLVTVVVIGLVGFSLDKLLAVTESRVLRWRNTGFPS